MLTLVQGLENNIILLRKFSRIWIDSYVYTYVKRFLLKILKRGYPCSHKKVDKKYIQNSWRKIEQLKVVNYFLKKCNLRWLPWFWICLCRLHVLINGLFASIFLISHSPALRTTYEKTALLHLVTANRKL